ALACVRGDLRLRSDEVAAVVEFGGEPEGADLNLLLRRRRVRSERLRAPLDPAPAQSESLLAYLALRADARPIVLLRSADRHPGQRAALARLVALRAETIAVELREPFALAALSEVANLGATFGETEAAFTALADALCGAFEPSGTLPLGRAAFAR
ncbi:MAG: hypothetical protein ACREQ5_40455, partial [Candidatus Dormibacteria bacterium]